MKPYYEQDGVMIYHGDCRDIMPTLPELNLVLTDPPYGLTANSWDIDLPVAEMLRHYKTVIMTASQPFAAKMIVSDLERFRHEWIWNKTRGSNFANTSREPMKEHETILCFSDPSWIYNPQHQQRSISGASRVRYSHDKKISSENYRDFKQLGRTFRSVDRVPSSIQTFNVERTGEHPTQKPVALFHYLVCTYSNDGDIILDPFMGSGTTLRAAKDLGRKAIGIEIEERYCEIAAKRMSQSVMALWGDRQWQKYQGRGVAS